MVTMFSSLCFASSRTCWMGQQVDFLSFILHSAEFLPCDSRLCAHISYIKKNEWINFCIFIHPTSSTTFPFPLLVFFFFQNVSMHVFMFCKKELFLLLMLSSIMIIVCVREAELYKQAVVKCTWEGQNDRRDAADHASSWNGISSFVKSLIPPTPGWMYLCTNSDSTKNRGELIRDAQRTCSKPNCARCECSSMNALRVMDVNRGVGSSVHLAQSCSSARLN